MPYVDAFVLAVPEQSVGTYKAMARTAGKVWKEHGALAYVECLGDDVPYANSRPSHGPFRRRRSKSLPSHGSFTHRANSAIRSMRR